MKLNDLKFLWMICLLCCFSLAAQAQTPPPAKHHHKKNGGTNGAPDTAAATNSPTADAAVAQQQQLQQYANAFVPADPWRLMEDKTNYAKGADWVQFEGQVLATSADGIVLQGWYGEPLGYLNGKVTYTKFFLSNYPRHVTVSQFLSRNDRLVAFKSGTKDDMPNLDYEQVWVPQLSEEQKAHIVQNKSKTDAKVLAWHQELADKGDAYGEYKMGMRYLNGDGVDKDTKKGRDLLTKAAAQGNKDATDELAKLPAP